MRPTSIIGLLLIIGGLAVLLMGGFSYTKSDKVLDIGPLEATVQTQGARAAAADRRRAGARRRRGAAAGRQQEEGLRRSAPGALLPSQRLDRVDAHRPQAWERRSQAARWRSAAPSSRNTPTARRAECRTGSSRAASSSVNAAATPSTTASDHEREGPADDQPQQARASGAEGDPQPELGGALRDGIGDDAVDANAGEQQREPAEAAGQQRQQALVDQPLVALRDERLHVRRQHRRDDGLDLAFRGLRSSSPDRPRCGWRRRSLLRLRAGTRAHRPCGAAGCADPCTGHRRRRRQSRSARRCDPGRHPSAGRPDRRPESSSAPCSR